MDPVTPTPRETLHECGAKFHGPFCDPRCPSADNKPPKPEPSGVLIQYMDDLLRHYGGYLAARYGAPVYLVGSALTKEKATDIDIRVVLPDAEWEARFGVPARGFYDFTDRYVAEVGKQSKYLVGQHAANVDLQVQPESVAMRWADKPRRLISPEVPSAPREPSAAMVEMRGMLKDAADAISYFVRTSTEPKLILDQYAAIDDRLRRALAAAEGKADA